MTYYSQIGQDQYYIENIAKHKRGGVFLDIGANDGLFTSNTATLELEYGWTGVCVEANPRLIPRLKANRPHSVIENCAIWDEEIEILFEIPKRSYNGIRGDLLSRITNVKSIDDRNKTYFRKHFSAETEIVTIPARTITGLLSKLCDLPTEIDYMSLDTEGAELEALKGIDFNNVIIHFMTIEHGNRVGMKEIFIDYLATFGYKVHRINKWDIEFEL